jgi:hypothetical protein
MVTDVSPGAERTLGLDLARMDCAGDHEVRIRGEAEALLVAKVAEGAVAEHTGEQQLG